MFLVLVMLLSSWLKVNLLAVTLSLLIMELRRSTLGMPSSEVRVIVCSRVQLTSEAISSETILCRRIIYDRSAAFRDGF